MTSPYVRRRRLADELRRLREERDLTTGELARLVYQSRTKISKLENAQIRPDLAEKDGPPADRQTESGT